MKKHCEKYDQNMCIAAGLIWQLVIHSCLFFVSFSISRRDGENDGLLAGVPLVLPPSQAVSRPNFLPLPFRTPATQSSSVSDYRLITYLLRTSLPRRGSRWVALIFPSSPARLLFSLSPASLRDNEASAERLSIAFTTKGKRKIQVETFSKWETSE